MGLLISPNTSKIKIHGTPLELNSVYVRFEYTAKADGKTITASFQTYYDRPSFDRNELIITDIPYNGFSFELQPTETQSIDMVLSYGIVKFEEWGYSAQLEITI